MPERILKARDKLFWICTGFGGIIALYFGYHYLSENEPGLSDFTNYTFKKQFSIYVPAYLLPADSIYEKASLQFCDYSHEVFLVVVEEQKKELQTLGLAPSLPEYAAYVRSSIEPAISHVRPIEEKKSVINGMQALTNELEGDYGGKYVYYIFTVLENENSYYQVISWTVRALKPEVKKDIYTAIQSFAASG